MQTKIYMGEHSLGKMKELKMGKVYIICDPFMKVSHKVDIITAILEEQNITFEIFAEVIPDPTIKVVTEVVKQMKGFAPNTVIAFGGGSAIDTAKAVCYVYTSMFAQDKLSLIAVPTTSGTGSEVTSFSVISDSDAEAKYPLVSEKMIPDIAFLDPQFTLTVPSYITADTGIDVLTHAMEAYVSVKAQDFTDACAEKAIRLVWKYLETTIKNGADIEARMHMHNASCLAGIAFNQASLGICHSMAHALGARFHIPHGRSNAILLPHIISYNAGLDTQVDEVVIHRYAQIAELLGIWGSSESSSVCMLIQKIENLIKRVGIPRYITDLGIDSETFSSAINGMTEKAIEDRCTQTNPRVPTIKELEKIYMKLIPGK